MTILRRFGLLAAGCLLIGGLVTQAQTASAQSAAVVLPIDGYYDRQGVKSFGTYVDQAFLSSHPNEFRNNGYPKFTGFHAAADIDYTADAEANVDTSVRAMAAGTVIYKATVTGYGGVIVIRHQQPEAVTSLYGHVRISDAPVGVGDTVAAGQPIAVLGAPFSAETGGERKHLHFGIHRGAALSLNGHEPSQATLDAQWYNPNDWLRQHGAVAESALPSPVVTSSPSDSPQPEPSAEPEPQRGFFGKIWHALTGWL